MTNSHQRIFCYLPGVKKIRCTCIQLHVYLGAWHFYAALSFSNVCHQLKLCSPLKAQFQCPLYCETCRDPLKCKLLLIPLHSLSMFFFFFLGLAQKQTLPRTLPTVQTKLQQFANTETNQFSLLHLYRSLGSWEKESNITSKLDGKAN